MSLLSVVTFSLSGSTSFSKDAIRSIVISQRLLGTREIAVFHHTDCGMMTFSTPQLRDIVKKDAKVSAAAELVDTIDFLEFQKLEESVKEDVEYLKNNPLVLTGTKISGWIYHVESGKVGGKHANTFEFL